MTILLRKHIWVNKESFIRSRACLTQSFSSFDDSNALQLKNAGHFFGECSFSIKAFSEISFFNKKLFSVLKPPFLW